MNRQRRAVANYGLAGCLMLPARDFLAGIEAFLDDGRGVNILAALLASIVSWWIYVPLHELLHALGCVLGGGEVTRLDLSGIYGAAVLKRIFPFISVGSEYAGRLSGFNTNGNDFTYFLTDFTPFVLTILVGIPLLKTATSRSLSPFARSIRFGLAMPVAYAPFIAVTGDYYEMGSIVVTRLASFFMPLNPERWRGDDLFRLVKSLIFSGAGAIDVAIVAVAFLAGIVMIYATYGLGILWAEVLLKRR
jgi:hypothetical protein